MSAQLPGRRRRDAGARRRWCAAAAASVAVGRQSLGSTTVGWRPYDLKRVPAEFALRKGEAEFSDIPILNARDVPKEVRSDPEKWSRQPFVLRGDETLLRQGEALGRAAFLDAAKRVNTSIGIGFSWTIPAGSDRRPCVALEEYAERLMFAEWYDGSTQLEPPYAFDSAPRIPGLPQQVPNLFTDWNASAFQVPETATSLMMLGGPCSAAGWHLHGAAVQMVLHGWKRWLMYPVGRYPPGSGFGGESLTDWMRLVYPEVADTERAPIECILQPGDVIYIPDGWYHAVINLSDSLAISIQCRDRSSLEDLMFQQVTPTLVQQLRRDDPEALKDLIQKAKEYMESHPDNDLGARRALFYALRETHPDEAAEILLEGTRRDAFHVPIRYELASWLCGRASAGDAQALQLFQEAAATWKPHLERNVRSHLASWILCKHHWYRGEKREALKYHERFLELQELL